MGEERFQLICVIPGDLYMDGNMDVWRYIGCDTFFDDALDCYACGEELEGVSSYFQQEKNENVICHDREHGCIEILVPGEIMPVFNQYREIYKAEQLAQLQHVDPDSYNPSQHTVNYTALLLHKLWKIETIKEVFKDNAEGDES